MAPPRLFFFSLDAGGNNPANVMPGDFFGVLWPKIQRDCSFSTGPLKSWECQSGSYKQYKLFGQREWALFSHKFLARHQGEVAGTVQNLLVFQLHVAFPMEHQMDIPTYPESSFVIMRKMSTGRPQKLGAQVKNTIAGAISNLIYVHAMQNNNAPFRSFQCLSRR